MPSSLTMSNGALASFKMPVDVDGSSNNWPYTKLAFGDDGTRTPVESANPLPVNTEIDTVDLDSGGGTALRAAVGLLLAASGGPVALPGDATNGAKVQATTMPAADETTDAISAKLATDKVMVDLTGVTPKFVRGSVAASQTDASIVAGVATKKIRVLGGSLSCGATATDFTFNTKPAGAGTAISAKYQMGINGGRELAAPGGPYGRFETVAGEGLAATTSAGSTVFYDIVYIEV